VTTVRDRDSHFNRPVDATLLQRKDAAMVAATTTALRMVENPPLLKCVYYLANLSRMTLGIPQIFLCEKTKVSGRIQCRLHAWLVTNSAISISMWQTRRQTRLDSIYCALHRAVKMCLRGERENRSVNVYMHEVASLKMMTAVQDVKQNAAVASEGDTVCTTSPRTAPDALISPLCLCHFRCTCFTLNCSIAII